MQSRLDPQWNPHQEGNDCEYSRLSASFLRRVLRSAGNVRSHPVSASFWKGFEQRGPLCRLQWRVVVRQMGAGEQTQTESVRVHAVRLGSAQLRRHALRHGGTEAGPVLHCQPLRIQQKQGHAGRLRDTPTLITRHGLIPVWFS